MARQIQQAYAGSGQVRYEYKSYAFLGEASTLAAEAALCAADQEQFWPYQDTVFVNQEVLFKQGENSRRGLKQVAGMLGLDRRTFNRCFDGGQHRQDVQRELADGRDRGVGATPTVYVNEVNLGFPQTFEEVQQIIEQELAQIGQ